MKSRVGSGIGQLVSQRIKARLWSRVDELRIRPRLLVPAHQVFEFYSTSSVMGPLGQFAHGELPRGQRVPRFLIQGFLGRAFVGYPFYDHRTSPSPHVAQTQT